MAAEKTAKEIVFEHLRKNPSDVGIPAADLKAKLGLEVHVQNVKRAQEAFVQQKQRDIQGEVRRVALDDLVVDPGLQFRDRTDESAVDDYAQAIEDGERLPALTAFDVDGRLYLAGGFHRHLAARKVGLKEFEVDVRPGTMEDAIRFAIQDNARHGLRRSPATQVAAIRKAIELEPKANPNRLRELTRVSWDLCDAVKKGFNSVHELRKHKEEQKAKKAEPEPAPEPEPEGDDPYEREVFPEGRRGEKEKEKAKAKPEPEGEPEEHAGGGVEKLSDAEWLDTLPVRKRLEDPATFDRNALAYRALHESGILGDLAEAAADLLPEDARRDGPFEKLARALANAEHPRDWKVCSACRGKSAAGKVSKCNICVGGFHVR